jgi:phage nucleotide-binding protein
MICPYCGREPVFLTSKQFYGRDYGTNVYLCRPCNAYVGTHGRGKTPLGTLANKNLRDMRMRTHAAFDPLWKSKKMSRSKAYKWMAEVMELPGDKAHIGMFDENQCLELLRHLRENLPINLNKDVKQLEITNGAQITKSKKAKIIIYSKPGDGKTTVAGKLPGKTLVLDIDGTSQVLEGYSNVDVAKINAEDPHRSILEFYAHAKANIANYDNIFVDNLTHYQKLWLMHKGENTKSGMPELKDYALFDNHLLKVVETFNSLDANVIYTAWETTRSIIHDDGQQYNQFIPDIRDKIVNHVMGIVHVVARLVRKADGTRGFILEGNQSIFAKNHLDQRKGCVQEELIVSSTN